MGVLGAYFRCVRYSGFMGGVYLLARMLNGLKLSVECISVVEIDHLCWIYLARAVYLYFLAQLLFVVLYCCWCSVAGLASV